MANILEEIILTKREEIEDGKKQVSLETMKELAYSAPTSRDFITALKNKLSNDQPAVIAEIKRASPSKGILRQDFDPASIAISYEQNGAACLSVLTDEQYFQGAIEYLREARYASTLPILRKDFIVDEYQVFETKAIGADAILLIVAALTDEQLKKLSALAQSLGLAVLVESHTGEELARALLLDTPLIGINNRNLTTFETSLDVTLSLKDLVQKDKIVITESGILSPRDVEHMRSQGVNAFLVGEAFMKALDPGKALTQLFGK